ncbi:branched-chain amino acid ABC transporter permease [Petrotoga sp. 9PWA.NaAc.5.4]|uniref:branched-chain amino acid ABC transporter permease n=1 Tax=Petrotoga sp. 9PWA.NaAc.5.4 TaxID=1434328 RepID=UPI000CC3912C|nr:branched-chain amino acid ABC transporter permease [Petrotoga sp. 9PWA.NaAc.5.4]PNR95965.1 ABC transporter permease [Petrotoga sp. 9PWA.NaAc.5.4]
MRNILIFIIATLILISLPFFTGAYFLHVLMTILIYMTLALSWDIMLRTGQLSFGIAGFFGVGAYASIITFSNFGFSPILSIFFAAGLVALIAAVLGFAVLKLREIYFAITTLALTMVFSVIIRNIPKLTGGASGKVLSNVIFNGDSTKIYWLILSIALITIIISEVFTKTRIQFAINSIRNDEIIAKSSGINIFKYLIFVFIITSALQGATGAIYAQQYGFVSPETTFSLDFLLLPMAMALVGGIYSTWGAVIGAIILGFASEYLKLIMPYGHLIIYGVMIVLIILFLPNGIYGTIIDKMYARKAEAKSKT